MRARDDSGLSLPELLVVLSLMGMIMGAVYGALTLSARARTVNETQAQFSRDITAPIRVMDASLTQSLVPAFGTPVEPYRARIRMPSEYVPGQVIEHEFQVGTDGRLVQTVWRVSGATSTKVRDTVWSQTNANRALSVPLLTYYRGATETTSIVSADSVVVEVCSRVGDQTLREKRRVTFRNR